MANGTVVLYASRFGKPLQTHHKVVLDLNAKAIARIKGYKFEGPYDPEHNYSGPLFFENALRYDAALAAEQVLQDRSFTTRELQ